MSRVFVCLFVLFILSIAIRFGDCENTAIRPECKEDIIHGSDKTKLSPFEQKLKNIMSSFEKMENFTKKILGKDKDNSQSNKDGSFSDILNKLGKVVPQILPGTLWCGNGDRASSNDSLGTFNNTDACCRAHDNCENDILAGNTERNLMNNGMFTRSSCSCDKAFYNCLTEAENFIANSIGETYFNILQPQCFRCICPKDDCELNDGTDCKDHCIKYEWVDSKEFKWITKLKPWHKS